MEPHSIEGLASRAMRGDDDAFRDLYLIYEPRLRTYFTRYVPEPDVGDLVQDTLTHALIAVREARIRCFSAWLWTTARNRRITYYRDRPRQPATNIALGEHSAAGEAASPLERDELLRLLGEALEQLPGHYRSVAEQRYLLGLSYDEIARGERISRNALAIRLHRARRLLRRFLEGRI